MNFYTWIKQTSEYLLALVIFATVAGLAVAVLAYGWMGLAVGLTAGIVLWLTPWQRIVAACVHLLAGWMFAPDVAPKHVHAHERLPRRIRRQAPAHLLPYDRLKVRHGEHVAALLFFASCMGVLIAAAAVWVLGAECGLNNPGSKAAATLLFGGIGVFSLWRPDVEWNNGNNEYVNNEDSMDDVFYNPAYEAMIVNIYHRDD